MAGMFDYSPFFGPMPPGGGMNEGLSHVSNALDRLAQRRQQYQMHRERLEAEMREREMMERGLMARTEAENAARAEAAQQKAEWDAKLDMEKRAQDSQKDLFDIMAAGDVERARALAQGRMMTMAPHARERVATPAEQPITGDQADDMMNAIDWFQQSKGIDAQNEQIARRDQEDPIFRFTTPLGSSFDYRRGAKREADLEAGRRLADELEASLRGIPMTPYLKQAVGEELPKVRGGAYAGGKEDPNKVIRERMQHLEDEANRNRRAASVGTRPIRPGEREDNDRQLATAAQALLRDELNREDYKDQLTEVRNTQKMLDMLQSENPAAQKMALGIWAKEASGPGAVQQSERNEFVNTVGGYGEKFKKAALQYLSNGEVPEEMRAIFADAARNVRMKRQMETLGGIRESVRSMFATHPNAAYHAYADWAADRVASTVLPKKKPGGSGGTDAKRAELKELLKRLRK